MCNSKEVASAGNGDSPPQSLSADQLSRFWDLVLKNLDDARAMASGIDSPKNADDLVNSAALRAVESLQKQPSKFPASAEDFRGWFLLIVKNHSISCVRVRRRREYPAHSHWSDAPEPEVCGSQIADRDLDRVFARNDQGKYDAPAPAERHVKEDLDELHHILESHLEDLTEKQHEIIEETFYEKRKRAKVAARHGISESTYDNHLQAAYRTLRESLQGVVDIARGLEITPWYDRIEELLERYAAAQPRRLAARKGKRSTSKGERSTIEGERRSSADESGTNSRAAAAPTAAADDSSAVREKSEAEVATSSDEAHKSEAKTVVGECDATLCDANVATQGREHDHVGDERGTVRHERRNVGHKSDWLVR